MKKKLLFLISILIFVFCSYSYANGPGKDATELESKVSQLEQEMKNMQERHRSEMEELKNQIKKFTAGKMETKPSGLEVKDLRRLAEQEAAKEITKEEKLEEAVFKSSAMGLQALNPEISITGDMVNSWKENTAERKNYDFDFRNLGIHFESYLDPYTRFKAAVPVEEGGASLGEAYFTRYGFLKDVNITLGKFRQQFGIVNRWHKHGLDQVDFPLALRQIYGGGGLNQTGLSLDWQMPPLGETSQELTFQMTNGENSRLFEGNSLNNPCLLAHYKNYRDLSKDSYLELGGTALLGWNDRWGISSGGTTYHETDHLYTGVFGLDLTYLWEPTERMRYRNLVWRNEGYLLNRELIAPDGSGKDSLTSWGAYSYIQSKINRTLDIGIRGDFYRPDTKSYASVSGLSLSPLAETADDVYQWQVGPYITWQQSPFVKFRVEYNHQEGRNMGPDENKVMFQIIFSAGPHKHERY